MLEANHEKMVRVFLEPARPDSTLAEPDPGPRDITFTGFFNRIYNSKITAVMINVVLSK